jgi:glycosyltransferase involved in cell wall biosynthesis
MLKVLAAPASYILDEKHGSEYTWSCRIMENLNAFNVYFYALTVRAERETRKKLKNVKIIETNRRINLDIANRLFFMFDYFEKSVDILKNEHIDLIHHISPLGFRRGFNLLAVLGFTHKLPFVIGPVLPPNIYTSGDELNFVGSRKGEVVTPLCNMSVKLVSPALERLFRKTLEMCDVLITIHKHAMELYQGYVNSDRIKIIPPGVDIGQFRYITPSAKIENDFKILAIGYLLKRKGFDYLIKSMPTILKEYPNLKLIIVGKGPQEYPLWKLAKELKVDDNVVFRGFVPNNRIQQCYYDSDIFCSSALTEVTPTLLEALACGRPIVATNVGSTSEFVDHGKTGILVPTANSDAIADAILKLLQDEGLRLKMGLNGRRRAEQTYAWDVIAKEYYCVYSSLTL